MTLFNETQTESSLAVKFNTTYSELLDHLLGAEAYPYPGQFGYLSPGTNFDFLEQHAFGLFEGATPEQLINHFIIWGSSGSKDGFIDLDVLQSKALNAAFHKSLSDKPKRARFIK